MTDRSIYGKVVGIGAIVLAMLLSSTPVRANMIENAGFEAGTFDYWSPVPPAQNAMFFVSDSPHAGLYAAWFGTFDFGGETLSQDVATVAGDTYVVDFWLAHGMTDQANNFSVWWNGVQMISMTNAPSFPYTAYSFSVVAGGASSTLMFAGREVIDYFMLDDVSVLRVETLGASQVVPEPLTLLLVGTGVSGLMRSRRRRNRAAAAKA